jgi:hypothetical protein
MNGVTKQVFLLPLMTSICSPNSTANIDVKKYLEENTLANIDKWRFLHLLENQTVKRKKALKKTP